MTDLALDKEGKLLATVGGQTLLYRPGEVKLWSLQDGKQLASLTGHETVVWAVAISSDGKTLATGGYDGLIRLWDLPGGQPRGELKGHKNWVTDLAFVADTPTLVSASEDGTVKIWETQSMQEPKTLSGHAGMVRGVVVSPGGKTIASGGIDKTVRLWDREKGEERAKLEGHEGPVWAVTFAADGTLASAGEDGTVRVWNLADNQAKSTIKAHKNWITDLATLLRWQARRHQQLRPHGEALEPFGRLGGRVAGSLQEHRLGGRLFSRRQAAHLRQPQRFPQDLERRHQDREVPRARERSCREKVGQVFNPVSNLSRITANEADQGRQPAARMSRRPIAGCRALVTGASSGIGRSLALELARRGADLIVVARRRERLEQLAGEIAAMGRRCEVVAGDVTDPALREEAIACAADRLSGLDLLVNNAGVGAIGPFEQASAERLRKVMELNFFALVEMTRLALPLLKQGRRPMIVNIGSILSHQAVPESSEYCASKFAVRGFSQSLRAELKPAGIDVLLVSPAGTESEFWEHLVDQQGQPAFKGRPAPADLVARRIVRAIERGHRELFPTWSARLIWWGQRLAPGAIQWFVSRK